MTLINEKKVDPPTDTLEDWLARLNADQVLLPTEKERIMQLAAQS